jgi:glycosyltransferase involved in cell wall biosynthesis
MILPRRGPGEVGTPPGHFGKTSENLMGTMTPRTISAFIVCCNEERQIRRCLESVAWCDEIIVVDSGSTDNTLAICQEYTSKVFYHPWQGYVGQKQHALSLCSGDWVLNLDADEEVSKELAVELRGLANSDSGSVNGYYLNRVVFFLNRWWRKGGWYPEYRLRFCRRSATSWGGEEPHEKASVTGATARCTGELFHYSFSDLADYVRRSNTLSSNATSSLLARNTTFSVTLLLARPLARFLKFYVVKRGFREGIAGLIVAVIEAHSVLLKYSKLWEARHVTPKTPGVPQPGNQ